MELVIILLPLLGSIFAGLFGRFIGSSGSQLITSLFLLFALILSLISFYLIGFVGTNIYISLSPWFALDIFNVQFGFIFDNVTVIMLIVVTAISFLVHLYSIEYLSTDPHISRFMSYISLFTFFMLILVTGDNLIQIFIGWEGVGICSYLLINFWFTRINANKSAIQAIIMNRIGDLGIIIAIMTIVYVFKSVNLTIINSIAYLIANETIYVGIMEFKIVNIISFFILVGAIGKSAQIGLHTWLPSAMEGPTPVSALIHAATMVTAGVFILIRFSGILELAPTLLIVITIIGAITTIFAGSIGLVQNDIKKIIAYSTCSQLGYMVIACGISNYATSLYHLANHAFFKALLFLSAGAIIHALNDEQDIRKMGGLIQILPMTYIFILIGSLSLMGFPFLTGFYSKDAILEQSFGNYTVHGMFAYWIGTIAALCTAFYSIRLIYKVFMSEPNFRKGDISHEPSYWIIIPFILLGLGSIFIGYMGKDLFIGLGTNYWNNSLYIWPLDSTLIYSEFIDSQYKLLPVLCSLMIAIICFIAYTYNYTSIIKFKITNPDVYRFLSKKWYIDYIYNTLIGKIILSFSYNVTFKLIDRGVIELLGPVGIINIIKSRLTIYQTLQSGYIYHYTLIFLIGVLMLLMAVIMSIDMIIIGIVIVIFAFIK